MPVKRKVQLVLLFAGSLIPAGTTLYRIPNIIDRHGSQQYRSLLASIEILFATAVCNALVLGSFVRDRGVKKQRWKFGSLSDSIERTTSRRGTVVRHWGSDEDLIRDIGLGIDVDLREAPIARPAPMASAAGREAMPSKARQSSMGSGWDFPRSDTSGESDSILYKIPEGAHSLGDGSSLASPRRVSFFDVGGLLDEEPPRRLSSTRTNDTDLESQASPGGLHQTNSHEYGGNGLSPAPPRRGSAAFLQDVGGLLGPRTRNFSRGSGYELQTIHQERSPSPMSQQHSPSEHLTRQPTNLSLQDVGGLLK
ncbi:hypothetical protein BP6252_04077 [Coleophoma cylindrospora]|uniref:Uncharacterized protein n=1 Tax=Coleophoma cylindrospora TaxID=1849047 RepID=A0A3D8RZF8_9HELO|nr:hypothetical protein BP6252_04077 [Coleophoma cylindrospora]